MISDLIAADLLFNWWSSYQNHSNSNIETQTSELEILAQRQCELISQIRHQEIKLKVDY